MIPSLTTIWNRTCRILHFESKIFRRMIVCIWIAFFALLTIVPLYILLVIKNPNNWFGGMPNLAEFEMPENDLASQLISADGVSLGRFYRHNRTQVRYEQLPPDLVTTLLVSEDHRFRDHAGMDFKSYIRVALGIMTANPQGGGSTLSQQTAKNLFHTRGKEMRGTIADVHPVADLIISKTKEWILAIQLERNLTKEEIIALYLNTVSFNNHAYGIQVAAETYFNKNVRSLKIEESALLVGMLQSPAIYNPVRHPERALRKRNEVLRKLYRTNYFASREVYDSVVALPIKLDFNVHNHSEEPAAYLRSVITKDLLEWCNRHGYDLYASGLRIHVTLDSRLQRYAEEAMAEHMRGLQNQFDVEWSGRNPWVDSKGNELQNFVTRKIRQTDYYRELVQKFGQNSDSVVAALNRKKKMTVFTWHGDRDTLFSAIDSLKYYNRFLNAGLMAMNPNTGEIKAWAGGINHRYFKFDHVVQAKRQAGSTFKAFVFGKAIEDGYSPCYLMRDVSPSINIYGKIYQPANSNGGYGDGSAHTLRSAFAHSLNSVTTQLVDKLGPANIASFARRAGVESPLNPVYSIGLGTSDVSLKEMTGAYATFVNLGIRTTPFAITRIEDRYGNILETFTPKREQAMSPETAYNMIYMLKGVVDEPGGSAGSLSIEVREGNEVGGKTGTTNNASDGWFIGVTPELVTGIWVGGDERAIHFPDWHSGSGTRTAMPLWDLFMQKVYSGHEGYGKSQFKRPDGVIEPECVREGEFEISPVVY